MALGFVFDMDGTLFDTETISLDAMDTVASEFGMSLPEEFKLGLLGLPSEEIKQRFLSTFGDDFDYARFRSRKIEVQDAAVEKDGVPLKPGLTEILEYGRAQGISMAVATSTSRYRAINLLTKAGVVPYFQYILCGDEIKNGKPHPEIFMTAAEKLGLMPEECIAFEDSRNGIISAHRAGMFAILIPDKIEPDREMADAADLVCDSLFDAVEYIKKHA
ncbi:MAG: HAD family phosphatase [Clostridia bacterium]|nr:HAD family phosphatase [Clostridia bacterium]